MKRFFGLFLIWAVSVFVFILYSNTSTIVEKEVVVENATKSDISLEPVVANNLKQIYASTEKEIPFCLFGSKNFDGSYEIDRLGIPQIRSSNVGTTEFKMDPCKTRNDFLGMIHNHERGTCYPSDTDLQMFSSSEIEIFMVYCKEQDDSRYVGVTREIFEENKNQ